MNTPPIILIVETGAENHRIDGWICDRLPHHPISRARIQGLLKDGHITVDGAMKAPSYRVRAGDRIHIAIPDPAPAAPTAQDLPLSILYEDNDLLVLNKDAGVVVHPAPGHRDGTLVNGLLAHCGDALSGIGGVRRPGIVHRLDKGTSGLMVVAKNDIAHQGLSAQFESRALSRTYMALVWGVPLKPQDTIDGPIGRHPRDRQRMAITAGGKPARTHYCLIETVASRRISLVHCRLETGRTHQIRVHMTAIGHPLLNDHQYGNRPMKGCKDLAAEMATWPLPPERPLLHAASLTFRHPVSGQTMTFDAPPPDDFQGALDRLRQLP